MMDGPIRRWLRGLVAASRPAAGAPATSAALGRLRSVTTDAYRLIVDLQRLTQRRTAIGTPDVENLCAGALAGSREAVALLEQLTGRRERHVVAVIDRLADGVRRALQGSVCEDVAARFGLVAAYWDPSRDSRVVMRPMSAGISFMAEILASGEIRTRLPGEPEVDLMLVRSTWGLLSTPEEGGDRADLIRVSRHAPHHIAVAEIARKARMQLAGVDGGVITVDVPGWMREQPSLTRAQASALATYGVRLEEEYGGPQEADWVLDRSERILIMRSRLTLEPAQQDDALQRNPLFQRTQAALALLEPLTLPPASPDRDSAGECVTVHDVLCYAYERGVQMAGITDRRRSRWPGRPRS